MTDRPEDTERRADKYAMRWLGTGVTVERHNLADLFAQAIREERENNAKISESWERVVAAVGCGATVIPRLIATHIRSGDDQ